jgi:hypothetical protein
MSEVTAEKLKADFQASPRAVSKVLGDALREFGYARELGYTTSITDEWVETEIRRLLGGGEAKEGPSLFLVGCLKDDID